MKKLVFLLLFIAAFPVNAIFSAYVNVTPETQENKLKSLSIEKMDNGKFLVRIPEFGWFKHVWLITCKAELNDAQKNFREYIWNKDENGRNVETLTKLGVGPIPPYLDEKEKDKKNYIEIILSEEVMSRSYIYVDFPYIVYDGGYFYSIDLPEYLRKINQK